MIGADRLLSPAEAVTALRGGRLVILPTETVYGLGANALDPTAVASIFAAKKRPRFNPVICHVSGVDQLKRFARVPRRLPTEFWPGPITVLLPHTGQIAPIVTAGSPLCGFRIPDHAVTLDIIRELDAPIAAPSANRSGRVSPTSASLAYAEVGGSTAGVVDGGPCRVGLESTVVLPEGDGNRLRVLRPGGVTEEQLRSCGFEVLGSPDSENDSASVRSPGSDLFHYAPEFPLVFVHDSSNRHIDALLETSARSGFARPLLLCFGDPPEPSMARPVSNLSPRGDLIEAAAALFGTLASVAQRDVDSVLAFSVPERDLGRAINDRLRRAAACVATFGPEGWAIRQRVGGAQ